MSKNSGLLDYLGDFLNNLNNPDHLDNLKPKAANLIKAMHITPYLTDNVGQSQTISDYLRQSLTTWDTLRLSLTLSYNL